MNVAILGGQGQVGTSLVQSFKLTKSSAVKTFSHKEIDVTFPSEITYESLKNFKPDIIINCAAFTHVDNAEKERVCLLYTSPSPRDAHESRMPSSA
mgnify:CR=1 FL=1